MSVSIFCPCNSIKWLICYNEFHRWGTASLRCSVFSHRVRWLCILFLSSPPSSLAVCSRVRGEEKRRSHWGDGRDTADTVLLIWLKFCLQQKHLWEPNAAVYSRIPCINFRGCYYLSEERVVVLNILINLSINVMKITSSTYIFCPINHKIIIR